METDHGRVRSKQRPHNSSQLHLEASTAPSSLGAMHSVVETAVLSVISTDVEAAILGHQQCVDLADGPLSPSFKITDQHAHALFQLEI